MRQKGKISDKTERERKVMIVVSLSVKLFLSESKVVANKTIILVKPDTKNYMLFMRVI